VTTELEGERVRLREIEAEDAAALRAIAASEEVSRWWGPPGERFPFDDPAAHPFTILVDGEVVGLIQYGEEKEPDYRHAWIDVFVEPRLHGRGIGSDAVATLARQLIEVRGHHRLTIDPAADNAAAIRCYEKVGFRHVGRTRLSWRDPDGRWRDGVLMELVVEPSTAPPG
jgi:aminoglycoside 6'-N-acetyltransferase